MSEKLRRADRATDSPAVPRDRVVDMARRIVGAVHPIQLILFGSQARGDTHHWSDADFIVVVPDSRDKRQVSEDIRTALRGLSGPYDAFVVAAQEMRRRGDLVGDILRAALREGRVLYDADLGLGDFGAPDRGKLEVGPVTESERRTATEEWLDNATDDLETAELAISRENLAGVACFHAQQAAEKALKSVLVYLQIDFPFSHKLDDIRDQVPDDWPVKEALGDLQWLSDWAVRGRYGRRGGATSADAERSLAQARAIFDAVVRDLASHGFVLEERQ